MHTHTLSLSLSQVRLEVSWALASLHWYKHTSHRGQVVVTSKHLHIAAQFSLNGDCSIAVAKRKSLFDDKPVEIQELTYIIKQDIQSLNEKIAQLQTVSGCGSSIVCQFGVL